MRDLPENKMHCCFRKTMGLMKHLPGQKCDRSSVLRTKLFEHAPQWSWFELWRCVRRWVCKFDALLKAFPHSGQTKGFSYNILFDTLSVWSNFPRVRMPLFIRLCPPDADLSDKFITVMSIPKSGTMSMTQPSPGCPRVEKICNIFPFLFLEKLEKCHQRQFLWTTRMS